MQSVELSVNCRCCAWGRCGCVQREGYGYSWYTPAPGGILQAFLFWHRLHPQKWFCGPSPCCLVHHHHNPKSPTMLVAPRYRSEGPTHGAHRARVRGVGSGTHNPLAGMPREAVDGASRIRPWNTPQRDRITRRNLVDRFPSPGGGSNLIGAHCARSRSMPAVGGGE